MRIGFWIFFLLSNCYFSQDKIDVDLDTCKTFNSLETAIRNPNDVFILDLTKNKLKEFPKEILAFKNLRVLILAKNKLSDLPFELAQLSYLEKVSISKNDFETFPVVLTELTNLQKLYLDQNKITAIPHDINKLKKLEVLDMWSNDLYVVPESISELENLKVFDLRVIQMTQSEQDKIKALLPNSKVYFSTSCNCAR